MSIIHSDLHHLDGFLGLRKLNAGRTAPKFVNELHHLSNVQSLAVRPEDYGSFQGTAVPENVTSLLFYGEMVENLRSLTRLRKLDVHLGVRYIANAIEIVHTLICGRLDEEDLRCLPFLHSLSMNTRDRVQNLVLPFLRELHLKHSGPCNLLSLVSCTSLRTLRVTCLTTDLSPLELPSLPRLDSLFLVGFSITSPAVFSTLTNLSTAAMLSCYFRFPCHKPFAFCTHLTLLHMKDTWIDCGELISAPTSLRSLRLGSTARLYELCKLTYLKGKACAAHFAIDIQLQNWPRKSFPQHQYQIFSACIH